MRRRSRYSHRKYILAIYRELVSENEQRAVMLEEYRRSQEVYRDALIAQCGAFGRGNHVN